MHQKRRAGLQLEVVPLERAQAVDKPEVELSAVVQRRGFDRRGVALGRGEHLSGGLPPQPVGRCRKMQRARLPGAEQLRRDGVPHEVAVARSHDRDAVQPTPSGGIGRLEHRPVRLLPPDAVCRRRMADRAAAITAAEVAAAIPQAIPCGAALDVLSTPRVKR